MAILVHPKTFEEALAWARKEVSDDPSLQVVPHAEFNSDPVSGGYAFVLPGQSVLIVGGRSGTFSIASCADTDDDPQTWTMAIEMLWAKVRRANRVLTLADLDPIHRAVAVTAAAGRPTVTGNRRALPDRLNREDLELAEVVLVRLRWDVRDDADLSEILRAFAFDDDLIGHPGRMVTHRCPLCDRRTLGGPRYPTSVCSRCEAKAVDAQGRRIIGANVPLSGGFVARFVDPDGSAGEVAAEVTESGLCWIEGHPCTIGEARFGGVVVESSSSEIPRRSRFRRPGWFGRPDL